ncbi:thioredoxin-dependent thiol peroxidase [Massilicoli timonensis]|uniref:thioredoxin-dependent peroxiredoxin n=1 Tax=Massilicoli timonensis TaxID=2015901 RepID=A0ABT1SKD2_9FIRM|nr:thioredoxin-dependent thiol peroxidase [Massilicoli timonensis]MCQ5121120.1 thioredoxin-dependent thiol peroxidase [Massilicoli timonensis]HIR15236.1 thioredoxin-dependent thiol peroxidase [Candidatus Onthosoma merdavium]
MLQVHTPAPDFTLPDASGKQISLHDFKGKKVVVYFYPKDNTPGCSKQACAFKDAYSAFQQANVIVIGISKDSQRSHQNFIQKYELPFLLLSDPQLEAIQAYDVWQEKKLYGKTYMGVVRATYIIDEDGMIEHVFEKADPTTNTQDVLALLSK